MFSIFLAGLALSHVRLAWGNSVTLAWNTSTSTSVAGYHVYQGGVTGTYTNTVNAGNTTNTTLSGLVAGATYYFAVTDYDSNGLESPYSNEVIYQVPVTNGTPPVVNLTSPVNGTVWTAPASLTLQAGVTTNSHTITKVQFYNGATLLGEDTVPPYAFSTTISNAGSYILSSKVVYDSSSVASSSNVSITVNAPLAPVVNLTSPANGSVWTAPAALTLQAGVTTNGHTITKVQFYNGTTLLGEDTAAPYAFSTTISNAGTYPLSAKVVYDAGAVASSSNVTVTVNAPPPPIAPAIVLTSPTNGASFVAPATFGVSAGVTTNGHTITKVMFYLAGTLVGQQSVPPYVCTATNVTAGNYNLTASVVYDSGNAVTSAPVSVVVTSPTPLPAPWVSTDIGATGLAGSATSSNGVFTINGAGTLGGTSDSFQFAYQNMTGRGEIRAKINAVPGAGGLVGIMIRESLSPGANYVFLGLTPTAGARVQYRTTTGANPVSSSVTLTALPNAWVRLVRSGSTLYAYTSTDGSNWQQLQTITDSMARNIYMGFAVSSGSATGLSRGTFSNVSVIP